MVWYLHEYDSQPIEQLPSRIRVGGRTWTGKAVYADHTLLGYKAVPNPPQHNPETHKVVWNKKTNRWNKKQLTADEKQINYDRLWYAKRQQRNDLLARSDWSQISSGNGVGVYGVPGMEIDSAKRDEYAEYRQKLRDMTKDFSHPDRVIFPNEPL